MPPVQSTLCRVMLLYAGEFSKVVEACQSFVTVIKSSNTGLKHKQLTMSYVVVDGVYTSVAMRLKPAFSMLHWRFDSISTVVKCKINLQ